MSRNNSASRKLQLQLESLESRDVPSATETTFLVTLPDSTTVTGEFSTPGTVSPTLEWESLTLSNLAVKINGETATVSGTPTAEFAYGDLLGVTASASYSGTTVQIDDAIATDGGDDAQIGYVSGSATSCSTTTGHGGSLGMGGGMYASGSGSISGFVWENSAGDGTFDAGESGVSGVTVNLLETSGTVYATTTTNGSGDYSFTDLSDNPYVVEVESSETFTQPGMGTTSLAGSVIDPVTGMTAVSISGGQAITGIDAGIYTAVTVEGNVFVDADDSGYFHSPDAVLDGDSVSLENSSGTVLSTIPSDSSGAYSFEGLAPGTYKVVVGEPLGYEFTTENATDDPSLDSEVNASTGVSSTVTLSDGASAATINAGLTVETGTASISGTITTEASGTDTGASGLTVQLSDAATGTILQTTTTDGSGDYSFSSLVAGSYAVGLEATENIASGGAFDPGTYTASETLTSGQALTGVNADLSVPEQISFTLDGTAGTISFSIPWSSVDPTEMGQSIALTDFTMTFGSSTFYQGSTTFSTSPAADFSYGALTGLTFAFDPSGAGVPYNSLSMSNGMTLSGYNTTLDSEETSTVSASLPYALVQFGEVKTGDNPVITGPGDVMFEINVGLPGGPIQLQVDYTGNQSGQQLAELAAKAINSDSVCQNSGITATASTKGGSLTITGNSNKYVFTSLNVILTGSVKMTGGTATGSDVSPCTFRTRVS